MRKKTTREPGNGGEFGTRQRTQDDIALPAPAPVGSIGHLLDEIARVADARENPRTPHRDAPPVTLANRLLG